MNTITKATLKTIAKMEKADMKYSWELRYLFNTMQGNMSWLGASIKEMKNAGITMDNSEQIEIYVSDIIRGMGIKFESYITVVSCYDLQYATIKDFNGLVKACYKEGE
ncbi:MAG TPA: hypothetical protein VFD03_06190 [Clostridia bacterium]|nr:hypothetical protein [Clostridia bacterium]